VWCHKNSWIFLTSTYYWLRPTITIRFDSKWRNTIRTILLIMHMFVVVVLICSCWRSWRVVFLSQVTRSHCVLCWWFLVNAQTLQTTVRTLSNTCSRTGAVHRQYAVNCWPVFWRPVPACSWDDRLSTSTFLDKSSNSAWVRWTPTCVIERGCTTRYCLPIFHLPLPWFCRLLARLMQTSCNRVSTNPD